MKKKLALVFFAASFSILICSPVFASQAMPRYGINEATKECSEFFMGDECTSCSLPEGWQMIKENECPEAYNKIKADSICTPIKNAFCCTVQHSGANGDCEDVVVNNLEKKCAFVEDIDKCEKLPENWSRAEELETWRSRLCPFLEYVWLEKPLLCGAEIIETVNIDKEIAKREIVDVVKDGEQIKGPIDDEIVGRMIEQGSEQNELIKKDPQKIKTIFTVIVLVFVAIFLFFIKKRIIKF